MHKTIATIVKKGDKWCVVSEAGKNLGCSNTEEGAKKRLRQVEYFKGQGMNYDNAFRNMARSLSNDIDPTDVGQAPTLPNKVDVASESIIKGFSSGSIAGQPSKNLLDTKDHFPVFTETQARSSLSRAMQLTEVPVWYNGNLSGLRKEVFDGITKAHPVLVASLSVNVPAAHVIALSDGMTPAETTKKNIDDPADVAKTQVPSVKRPTLTSADLAKFCESDETRIAFAGKLMECIEQQEADLQNAKKIATTLIKKGVSPEQFDSLHTYLQSDILRELIYQEQNANASVTEDRRLALLARLQEKKS